MRKFELVDLPYEMNALEPYISKRTLEYHHDKYHRAYLVILNKLIQKSNLKNLDLETIIKVADGPIFNYAAQVWNHTFFFEGLKPAEKNPAAGSFEDVIKKSFGTVSFFKNAFVESADSLFGVGWIWLVLNQKGTIEIMPKNNAENPLRLGFIPLMTCDVWEHAYYLDYQNRFNEYMEAFWKLVNWDIVEIRYKNATRF